MWAVSLKQKGKEEKQGDRIERLKSGWAFLNSYEELFE